MVLAGCFSKDHTESQIQTNLIKLKVKFTTVVAVENCTFRLLRLKPTKEYFFSLVMFILNFKNQLYFHRTAGVRGLSLFRIPFGHCILINL